MNGWYKITHPLPTEGVLGRFVLRVWKRVACKRGFHLFDEMYSSFDPDFPAWGGHGLYCDACEMFVPVIGGDGGNAEG